MVLIFFEKSVMTSVLCSNRATWLPLMILGVMGLLGPMLASRRLVPKLELREMSAWTKNGTVEPMTVELNGG